MDIKQIIKNTTKDTFLDLENISVKFPGLCIDFFLQIFPCSDDSQLNQLLEQLDNKLTINLQKRQRSKQQRQLAQFQPIYFNDILNDYWSQTLSKKRTSILLSIVSLVADYEFYL